MAKPPSDYEVGYGKPPSHTRFKPGQSGNPCGRPKKDTALYDAFERVMGRKVAVRENGTARKVSVAEAVLLRVAQDAMAGKPHAIKLLLSLMEQSDSRRKATARTTPARIQELLEELAPDALMQLRNVADRAAREVSPNEDTLDTEATS